MKNTIEVTAVKPVKLFLRNKGIKLNRFLSIVRHKT